MELFNKSFPKDNSPKLNWSSNYLMCFGELPPAKKERRKRAMRYEYTTLFFSLQPLWTSCLVRAPIQFLFPAPQYFFVLLKALLIILSTHFLLFPAISGWYWCFFFLPRFVLVFFCKKKQQQKKRNRTKMLLVYARHFILFSVIKHLFVSLKNFYFWIIVGKHTNHFPTGQITTGLSFFLSFFLSFTHTHTHTHTNTHIHNRSLIHFFLN